MIRSLFSALGMFIRLLLAFTLIAGLVFLAFVAYRGSQPIQLANTDGTTYWQFVRERIGSIESCRQNASKCNANKP